MPLPHEVFVTGATGLAGSHIVERLRGAGVAVRALVRQGSDARELEALGVRIVRGDITQSQGLAEGLAGCDALVHCAATVGEGISRRDLMHVNAGGVTRLLEAAQRAGVGHAVVLSSLAVLGTRAHHGTDESAPYGHTGDPYLESKIAGEEAARRFASDHDLPTTILRPTQIYGPRDRAFLPVVVTNLRERKMIYVDRGVRLMSITHAANVAEAVVLALGRTPSGAEIFHVTDGRLVSRREFVETICKELDIEPPRVSISYPILDLACNLFELGAHLAGKQQAPLLNRYRFKFLACHLDYSIARAREVLGYRPVITPEVGLVESARWLAQHRQDLFRAPPRPVSRFAQLLGDKELVARNAALAAARPAARASAT